MGTTAVDEWGVIERLLPWGWKEAAREKRAFRRARYLSDPAPLLRLLLFHAVNDSGLRESVAQAGASGIARMSQVALLKRLRTSGDWLAWIGSELCRGFRDEPRLPEGLRPRAIDSTTVQGPAAKGIDWRVHYTLDLLNLNCDWFEVGDAKSGEALEKAPLREGDVLIGDRNFLRVPGVRAVVAAGAHVLVRMRWCHPPMVSENGRPFRVLAHTKWLRVGRVGQWAVRLIDPAGKPIPGRVVAIKLPKPIAEKAARRAQRESCKKHKRPDPRSLQAARFVMVFTTLPSTGLNAAGVLNLYRCRWQIELAFKRLKQLLRLGRLPHKDQAVARSWILAKLVVALLLELLYRNARAISPWGYHVETPAAP